MNTPANETAEQLIARLTKENEEFRKAKAGKEKAFRCAIGTKKGLCIYGLNNSRFPVTLYLDQADKLIEHIEDIKTFVNENRTKFATKGE